MPPAPWTAARSVFITLSSLISTFRQQRLARVSWLAVIIFALALIFAFLAFAPILSPFVYPLF